MLQRVVGVVMMAATAGGCGAAAIQGSSAAALISRSLAQRYHIAPPKVRCPSRVPSQKGIEFACTTTVDGQTLAVDATVTGSSGRFHPQPADGVISVRSAERTLAADLSQQLRRPVTVTCPPVPALIVSRPGRQLTCAVGAGGRTRRLQVTLTDTEGDISYALVGPASSG
jgi:hypothetical protein